MKRKYWFGGSFTVEAAFVVPFTFLVLLSLTCLFKAIVRQNTIRLALMQAVQTYGCYGEGAASLEGFAAEQTIISWREREEGAICYVSDEVEIPFLGSRFLKINCYQQMTANDYSGISMISEGEGEEIVYIARNGQVYHADRQCTYLKTRIRTVTVHQAMDLRNQSGGKYYPCESCCRAKEQEDACEVYITSYGDRYHLGRNCFKLKRRVRQVHRSEVGDMPPCSKCGKIFQDK